MDKFPRARLPKWSLTCVPARSEERAGLDDSSMTALGERPVSGAQNRGFLRFMKSRRRS